MMRKLALGLVALAFLLWLFGPYEPADLSPRVTDDQLGDDLDAYLATVEAAYSDITPGVEKRIVWAGARGQKTPLALVYVHGFSATSQEIRPVPDLLAAQLEANLVYTRLTGHGRDGAAMAEATVRDWTRDLTEALAVARRVGTRVVVISTSTGGTLVTALAQESDVMDAVAGLIFVSPNYGVNSPLAKLLDLPAARYWTPLVAGQTRSFAPANAEHARYWTTTYPSVSVMPMAALIREVRAVDPAAIQIPALFRYHPDDQVVRSDLTDAMAQGWGGPVTRSHPRMTAEDDPLAHVIAGDVLSPGQTQDTLKVMRDWIEGLP